MANNTKITPATDKTINNYVPFGGQDIVLGEEATMPVAEFPTLQYASGLKAQRPQKNSDGTDAADADTGEVLMDNILFTGFFTEIGKHADLDEVMRLKKAPVVEIAHGGGEVVRHWAMQKISVFLAAKGLPSLSTGNGQAGMVYMWRQKRNSTKTESVVYVQVVIRQLLPEYVKPFVLTLKSTQSTDLLQAMSHQYKVIARAHEELKRVNRDIALPLWSYALPMGPSKDKVSRGPQGRQSTIFPVTSMVPKEITGEYLYRHEIPMEFVDILRDIAEKSVEWATSLHQSILRNVEPQEPWAQGNSAAPVDENPF